MKSVTFSENSNSTLIQIHLKDACGRCDDFLDWLDNGFNKEIFQNLIDLWV